MNQKIEIIIVKFLMNTANIEELEALTDWINKPGNKQYFKNYVRINYAMDINMKQFDTLNAKKEYLRKIKQDKSVFYKYRVYNVLKYPAAAIIVFGLGYFFKDNIFNTPVKPDPIIVNTNIILPGTDKATLTLEDGSVVALEKGNNYETQNVKSNGEEIIYDAGERSKAEMAYNYLTIPRGGQFFVKLSDGTQVWLNSESKLKYPVNFIEGESRNVELIYGEAYFDVSPSTLHKGSKFKVFNQSQEIEVLGTEFNIKAYKDETSVYTTLVEGKVAVGFNGGKENLVPNQQSDLNILSGIITVTKVDVFNEISWKEGVFTFESKPLKEITKVLSRWYDVDIIFDDKASEEKRFNGSLNRKLKINQILDIIKNFDKIKDYEINKKTIVIK